MDLCDWVGKLLVVSSSDFLDSGLAVKSHSDSLVGLYKLIQLFCKLLILHSDDSNVIVEWVNFNLKVAVIIKKGRIAVSGTFELLSHVHDLVLLGSDLGFKIFDGCGKFNIPWALSVNSLLKINIFISVFLFKSLQVIKLVLETDDLVLKLNNFTLTVDKLCLLALEIHSLAINELIEVINPGKLLRYIVLKSSCLCS